MTFGYYLMVIILMILCKEDIRSLHLKNQSLLILILLAMGEGIVRVYLGCWNDPFESTLYEMMLLILRCISKGKMGGGDFIVLASLGLILPIYDMWMALIGSFLLLFPSALLTWIREKSSRAALPFLPFLTGGVLITKILNNLL